MAGYLLPLLLLLLFGGRGLLWLGFEPADCPVFAPEFEEVLPVPGSIVSVLLPE